jgi:hypothetical protein
MKPSANIFRNLSAGLLLAAVAGLSPLASAQDILSADTNVVQSVFVLPDNPKEGRDPFFPNSPRPYQGRPQNPGVTAISDFKLGGITGAGSRFFVIINNVTFGVGDDADVKTPAGGKVHVLCVQIKADSAVIEAGGQTLQLYLSNP